MARFLRCETENVQKNKRTNDQTNKQTKTNGDQNSQIKIFDPRANERYAGLEDIAQNDFFSAKNNIFY